MTPDVSISSPSRCRLCNSPTVHLRDVWDDRYGYPGRFALTACTHCGHITADVRMSPEQIGDLYTRYYPRSTFQVKAWSPPLEVPGFLAWWRGLRSSAFRWVPRNVRVLDIGCGFGESLGYHRQRGCDAHGVEADANILRVAARHGLQVRVGLFDPEAYAPSSFEVVTLDQVIEHVSDPVAVLRGVETVLAPGGMLVLSTPNARGWGARVFGQRWIHWHAPYHQQFFTLASMQRAAAAAGLTVASAQTVTNSAWLGFQWCHLAAPTLPGERSAFWNAGAPRSAGLRLRFAMAGAIARLGVNAALTRLFDAFGAGDNFVFVLRKPQV